MSPVRVQFPEAVLKVQWRHYTQIWLAALRYTRPWL